MIRPRSKYGNVVTERDGIKFHSAKEARRYGELKLLERAGEVYGLRLQPRFPLEVNGKLICTYVGDFEYSPKDIKDRPIVEDAKGFRTPEYKLKAKLFEALFGFPIVEV